MARSTWLAIEAIFSLDQAIMKWGKIIAFAFIGFGIFATIDGVRTQQIISKLKSGGKQVSAKVHQRDKLQSVKTSTYQIYVDYPVSEEEKTYRQIFTVPRAEFEQLKMGDEVLVTYLPDNPRHAIVGDRGYPIGLDTGIIPVAAAALAFGFFLLVVARRRAAADRAKPESDAKSDGSFQQKREDLQRMVNEARKRSDAAEASGVSSDGTETAEEASPYPTSTALKFQTQDPLKLQVRFDSAQLAAMKNVNLSGAELNDEVVADCELSIEHEPDEPEDSHVLNCSMRLLDKEGGPWHAKSLIHADRLYAAFLSDQAENQFVSELSPEERGKLASQPCFGPIDTMDDGRDYFEFHVGSQEITLRSKYLGMSFHLVPNDSPASSFSIVVSGLVDPDAREIPDFVCKLPNPNFAFENSARYDEDEELWEFDGTHPLKLERG